MRNMASKAHRHATLLGLGKGLDQRGDARLSEPLSTFDLRQSTISCCSDSLSLDKHKK